MRARLTWKVPRWSKAGWVVPHSAIIDYFGEDAGRIVVRVRRMVEYRRDLPRSQDTRHTLSAIATNPASANIAHLDDHTDTLLTEAAMLRHGAVNLRDLSADALADCAQHALAAHEGEAGRPETDDLALLLIKSLLPTMPTEMEAVKRDQLLADALRACGLAFGQKNVERLRIKAGQVV